MSPICLQMERKTAWNQEFLWQGGGTPIGGDEASFLWARFWWDLARPSQGGIDRELAYSIEEGRRRQGMGGGEKAFQPGPPFCRDFHRL